MQIHSKILSYEFYIYQTFKPTKQTRDMLREILVTTCKSSKVRSYRMIYLTKMIEALYFSFLEQLVALLSFSVIIFSTQQIFPSPSHVNAYMAIFRPPPVYFISIAFFYLRAFCFYCSCYYQLRMSFPLNPMNGTTKQSVVVVYFYKRQNIYIKFIKSAKLTVGPWQGVL